MDENFNPQYGSFYNNEFDDDFDGDTERYNYFLFYSSKKCKYCKKLEKFINGKGLRDDVSKNTKIIDVIECYKRRIPLPKYVSDVPLLAISDSVTNDIENILYGFDVIEWVKSNTKKVAFTEVSSTAGKNFYGRISFDPNKLDPNKNDDPSQFQEKIEGKSKSISDDDFSKFNKDYMNESSSLGLSNHRIRGGGDVIDDLPDKHTNKNRNGKKERKTANAAGSAYASVGNSRKSSGEKFAAFNS